MNIINHPDLLRRVFPSPLHRWGIPWQRLGGALDGNLKISPLAINSQTWKWPKRSGHQPPLPDKMTMVCTGLTRWRCSWKCIGPCRRGVLNRPLSGLHVSPYISEGFEGTLSPQHSTGEVLSRMPPPGSPCRGIKDPLIISNKFSVANAFPSLAIWLWVHETQSV